MTKEAFNDFRVANHFDVVTDGEAAMDVIYQRGEYKNVPRPDLVLLDLGLPKKHSGEILKEMKADSKLRSIPIVIIATSELDEDVMKSYCNYANASITKPIGFDDFITMMKSIGDFWLTFVKLPQSR